MVHHCCDSPLAPVNITTPASPQAEETSTCAGTTDAKDEAETSTGVLTSLDWFTLNLFLFFSILLSSTATETVAH